MCPKPSIQTTINGAGFYIYFCEKYGFPPTAPTALGLLQTVPTLTLKQAKSPLDCA